MNNKENLVPFFGATLLNENEKNNTAHNIADYLNETSASDIRESFQQVNALMSYYRCAILEVETKFRVLNEQFSFKYKYNPIDSIKTRLKSPQSIRDKLTRKNLPLSIDSIENKISDVAGIKVICSFVDDIYMLADCLLQQDDIRLIKKKDYIKKPKPNGYRSLHLIVEIPIFLQNEKRFMKVEVQLRTIAMEFWANLEHKLRYKKNLSEETLEMTARELNECAEMSAMLDSKMQKVRDAIEKN